MLSVTAVIRGKRIDDFQMLAKAVCVSHFINTLEKGMNPFVLTQLCVK